MFSILTLDGGQPVLCKDSCQYGVSRVGFLLLFTSLRSGLDTDRLLVQRGGDSYLGYRFQLASPRGTPQKV